MDDVYPAIYYQTIRDTGIDPVVCADLRVPVQVGREGAEESGSANAPVVLAEKALAKASEGKPRAPRKRAVKKATPAPVAAPKTARGTAKVAASG